MAIGRKGREMDRVLEGGVVQQRSAIGSRENFAYLFSSISPGFLNFSL
jgi:hypothetical protein